MDRSVLDQCINQSTSQLITIWNDLGLDPDTISSKYSQLTTAIVETVSAFVASETASYDQAHVEINELINSINVMRSKLQDNTPLPTVEGNIIQKKQHYLSVFDLVQNLYDERAKDFKEKLAIIHVNFSRLGDPIPEDLVDVGEVLNQERLAELEEAIEVSEAALAEREVAILAALEEYRTYDNDLDLVVERHLYDEPPMDLGSDQVDPITRFPAFTWTSNRLLYFQSGVEVLGLSSATLLDIQQANTELFEIINARRRVLFEIGPKIKLLWGLLGVSEVESQEWISRNNRLTISVLRECALEYHRLSSSLESQLPLVITRLRQEVLDKWDEVGASPIERETYREMFETTDLSMDLYHQLVTLINKVKDMIVHFAPIRALLNKRNEFLDDQAELDRINSDPDRFKRPRLLSEAERLRKKLVRLRPNVIMELKNSLVKWETVCCAYYVDNQHFLTDVLMVEDADILDAPTSRSGSSGGKSRTSAPDARTRTSSSVRPNTDRSNSIKRSVKRPNTGSMGSTKDLVKPETKTVSTTRTPSSKTGAKTTGNLVGVSSKDNRKPLRTTTK